MESMTGFGNFTDNGVKPHVWTLRSVNGKGLDIRTKLPQGFEDIEPRIREAAKKYFTRGSLSATLELTDIEQEQLPAVNEFVLNRLCEIAVSFQKKYPELRPASLDGLLNVRGVLTQSVESVDKHAEVATSFINSFEHAAEKLKQARSAEGKKMEICLTDLVSKIETLTDRAKKQAAAQPETIKKSMLNAFALIKDASALPEDRFMQEVTAAMMRADVREELDRLSAHARTARELFAQKEPVGRKLDFLCQEFNREANTLCSKSADIELTRTGMGLKTVIDQLREQIQNIE